jgi:2-dehydro-3-deoxyphosphogluconate aldolase/(4S)-4-hydroxy-2-oxoglutarate aldolase
LRKSHSPDTLLKALAALAAGGIRLAEITIDTPNALTVVQQYQARSQTELQLGVGTVTRAEQVAQVSSSQASFIVTPVCVPDVVSLAKDKGLGVLCGALTPTEIFTAFEAGADAAKVFPASSLGATYFKQLAAPLSEIPLVAVGGVSVDNAGDYLAAGAVAVAAGSALVADGLLELCDWDDLTARAAQFVARVKASGQQQEASA